MIESALLEVIAQAVNCVYISDLKVASIEQLSAAFSIIDIDLYTTQQWNYTLSYILSEDIHISAQDDIRQVLQEHRKPS